MTIPHLNETFSAEITVSEPETMPELLSMIRKLRHLGEVNAQQYAYQDAGGHDRSKVFDAIDALEAQAPEYILDDLPEILAAMDLLIDMFDPIAVGLNEWNYTDRRDARLAKLIRDSIAGLIPNPKNGRA